MAGLAHTPHDSLGSRHQASARIDIHPTRSTTTSSPLFVPAGPTDIHCSDYRCGCYCSNCFCCARLHGSDANRDRYGSPGSVPVSVEELSTRLASLSTLSSLNSIEGYLAAEHEHSTLAVGPGPTVAHLTGDLLRQRNGDRSNAGLAMQRQQQFFCEDGEDPFPHFIQRQAFVSQDPGPDEDRESGMFMGAMELGSSMDNNAHASTGETSMLSSFMSSLRPPSVTASTMLQGVGAGLAGRHGRSNNYLPLN